jgi:hypothetical protein
MQTTPLRRIASCRAAVLVSIVSFAASGCYVLAPPSRYEGYRAPSWCGGFGYASIGYLVHADFFGNIEGVDSGTGLAITVPPLAPAAFVLTAVVVAVELEGGGGGDLTAAVIDSLPEETVLSGWSDPNRVYISDFSVDLTYSTSRHDDLDHGGSLEYSAWLVGLRLAGPRRYLPRYYLSGGWGFYDLEYDAAARADADVGGPYLGLGFEILANPNVAFAIEYKSHFYFGDDDAGVPLDGGHRQFGLLMCAYW